MKRSVHRRLAGLIAALAAIALAGRAAAQTATIGVSPLRIEVALGTRPVAEAIQIMNLGTAPIELSVSVSNWILDEANQVKAIEPTEQSLDQWIVISPLRLSLPPGRLQTVRFTVRPKVKPEPGEHRAMIFFDEVPGAEPPVQGTRVVGRVGVAVYAHVGEVTRRAVLNCLEVVTARRAAAAVFDISSEGSAHARMSGRYVVWPAGGFPGFSATAPPPPVGGNSVVPEGAVEAAELPPTPVLPGFRRRIVMRLAREFEPGDYVLDIEGQLGEQPLRLAYPFVVPPDGGAKTP
jgi:hypothetical protein